MGVEHFAESRESLICFEKPTAKCENRGAEPYLLTGYRSGQVLDLPAGGPYPVVLGRERPTLPRDVNIAIVAITTT